jgi:hypothetical protein
MTHIMYVYVARARPPRASAATTSDARLHPAASRRSRKAAS